VIGPSARIYRNTPKTATRRRRGAAGAPPLAARDREKGVWGDRREDRPVRTRPAPVTGTPLAGGPVRWKKSPLPDSPNICSPRWAGRTSRPLRVPAR